MHYRIDEFAGLVHPRDGHLKVFALIDAYLDESGIHDSAPICAVAGYFGGRGQWRKFEADWREALDKAGVPLEKFHAKNFVKREGFFEGWTHEEQSALANQLAKAICAHKIYPVTQSVIVADFKALTLGERKFFTGARVEDDGTFSTTGCPDKPYFLPFQYCLRNVCSYAPVGGKAHFFFGLDRSFYEYASFLFKFIQDNVEMPNKERLGTPFAPRAKETPQLQAADYLAYLSYLHGQERVETGDWTTTPPMKPLNDIVQRIRDRERDCIFFDSFCLRGMLERELTPSVREALARHV